MERFDILLVLPVAILAVYGLLGLLFSPFVRGAGRWVLGPISLTGIVMAGVATWRQWRMCAVSGPLVTAGGLVRVDGFGAFLALLLLMVAGLTLAGSSRFL